jgi:hypothetical protein
MRWWAQEALDEGCSVWARLGCYDGNDRLTEVNVSGRFVGGPWSDFLELQVLIIAAAIVEANVYS